MAKQVLEVAVGVEREDADPVAGGDAEPAERSGSTPDPLEDLAGGARAVPEDGQRPVGTDLRCLPERLSYLHGLLLSEFDLVCDLTSLLRKTSLCNCCMLVTSEHALGRFRMSHIKPRVAGVGMVPFSTPSKSAPYDVMAEAPSGPRSTDAGIDLRRGPAGLRRLRLRRLDLAVSRRSTASADRHPGGQRQQQLRHRVVGAVAGAPGRRQSARPTACSRSASSRCAAGRSAALGRPARARSWTSSTSR